MANRPRGYRRERGRLGEEYTLRFLEDDGYRIVERNWHNSFGEIDLIAEKDGYLAFVEVRTRTAGYLVEPVSTVNNQKRKRIIFGAQQFLEEYDVGGLQPRFDNAEVILMEGAHFSVCGFHYYPNAYTMDDITLF